MEHQSKKSQQKLKLSNLEKTLNLNFNWNFKPPHGPRDLNLKWFKFKEEKNES